MVRHVTNEICSKFDLGCLKYHNHGSERLSALCFGETVATCAPQLSHIDRAQHLVPCLVTVLSTIALLLACRGRIRSAHYEDTLDIDGSGSWQDTYLRESYPPRF